MRYVGFPDGLEATWESMTRWWEACRQWTATHLIVETSDGMTVGESGWGFQGMAGLLEIKLAPAHWGQGYASDALSALIGYLFEHTTIERVVVTPHREHIAARRLYHHLGFRPETMPPHTPLDEWETWTLTRPHPSPPPTTLIFDWGGVLMHTLDDRKRRMWESQLGLPAGGVDQAVFGSDAWHQAQLGEGTAGGYWQAIGESLNLTTDALSSFRRDFWAGDRLDRQLLQRIHRWKTAGYQIALLSNHTFELEALIDEHQLRSLFDLIVISAHEGIAKPASRIFWRALNQMGINPADALFIDDFLENVSGAKNVGLHAIQFEHPNQAIKMIEQLLPLQIKEAKLDRAISPAGGESLVQESTRHL